MAVADRNTPPIDLTEIVEKIGGGQNAYARTYADSRVELI